MHEHDALDILPQRTNRRQVSRRTLGLLAAAAVTSTVGLAVMTNVSGAGETPRPADAQATIVEPGVGIVLGSDAAPSETVDAEADVTLFDRGRTVLGQMFTEDDPGGDWENCPACGMG